MNSENLTVHFKVKDFNAWRTSYRKEERTRDGRAAMTEYEAEARATRAKTARLKALRLAKEAQTVIAL